MTLREGSSTGTGQMNLVPGGLFLRYTLLAPLEVTSGEADLWFIRHNQTEYVLKLYRYGIEPKAAMTQKLQALAAQHVVKVEEHGKFGNRAYEVMEKIEHGDLRKLAKPVAAEQLKEVLKELSEAVSHLHTEGILHRDLKPANVLLRSREPLDLVLTDFGISSLNEGTMHLTNANRTASYSAPEALTGVVSAASDWWSVGVMVLELLKGVHPFAGKSEQVINFQLVSKGIVIPADTAAEWAELLKGLLTRDHEQRWQGEQVAKWLTGARNQPTHYEGDRQQTHTHKPYQFGGKDIYTAQELAVALIEDWANGAKNFGRGFVAEWVKSDLRNFDLASRLMDVYEDKELSADEKLSAALVDMDRSLPGMWKGAIINREWAAREPEAFQALRQSRVRSKLERQPSWPTELVKQLDGLKGLQLSPDQLKSVEWVVITGEPLKTGDQASAGALSEPPMSHDSNAWAAELAGAKVAAEAGDWVAAVKWYRKAADQGDAEAQYGLGNCYREGQGVEEDDEEAVKWYRKAADQGNADAQYHLGDCYRLGDGFEFSDDEEAVEWFRQAADQGNAAAQYMMGVCYCNGQGVA